MGSHNLTFFVEKKCSRFLDFFFLHRQQKNDGVAVAVAAHLMRRKLPPVQEPHAKIGYSVFPLPLSIRGKLPFVPSATNLFKLHKKTRALYPLCYLDTDNIQGYVGLQYSRDTVQHETFRRFPPRKLYIHAGHTLVPPRRSPSTLSTKRLPKIKKRKKSRLTNPFMMHMPNAETIFLVKHERHGARPVIKRRGPRALPP